MSEVFDFSRFWKYFKYDLIGNLRENKVKIATFLILPIAFYLIVNIISLFSVGGWTLGSSYRMTAFSIFVSIFVIYYPVLCYGFMTEKQQASVWLMVPVSITEKYVSMLLNVLIVVPIGFVAVYFALDALLCLLTPDSGTMVSMLFSKGFSRFFPMRFDAGESLMMSGFSVTVLTLLEFGTCILLFLLGGLCFKKSKIAKTILAAILASIALLVIFVFIISLFASGGDQSNMISMIETLDERSSLISIVLNILLVVFVVIPFVALALGVFYRLKTVKH